MAEAIRVARNCYSKDFAGLGLPLASLVVSRFILDSHVTERGFYDTDKTHLIIQFYRLNLVLKELAVRVLDYKVE